MNRILPAGMASEQRTDTGLADAPRADLVMLTVNAVASDASGAARFCLGDGTARARRAASCLVAPQPGDIVLVAVCAGDEPAIISVLTRASTGAATLSVPDAAGLELTAPEITLAAQGGVTAQACVVAVEATEGRFKIAKTHFLGDAALLVLDTAETLYSSLHSYAERLIVKAGYALRLVDEVDSTVASTVLVQAKQTYSLQATQTLLSSTQDMRLDGERISMG